MESVTKKEFTADIVREHSCTPVLDDLGKHQCTIELFRISECVFNVEWDIPILGETVNIGIWTDNSCPYRKVVTDYDGVFSVPKEIQDFLEECGFNCDYLKI